MPMYEYDSDQRMPVRYGWFAEPCTLLADILVLLNVGCWAGADCSVLELACTNKWADVIIIA